MKICVTGLRGIPGVMGGVETHCQELFPRLKRLHADNDYIVLARKPYVSPHTYEYSRVTVVPLPCWRNKYFEALSNTLLAILYARFVNRCDLFHIHAIGPALLAPLARALGMRLVITHHGKDYDRKKWNGVAKLFLRLGETCAISNSKKLIVVSKSLAAELKRRYPKQADKIEYIPNGVSTSAGGAVADWDLDRRFALQKGKYILGVGRLVPEKGFHELIGAFRLAKPSGMKLAIAGKADHEDRYSRALLREAGDTVVFTGFQDAAILRQLYAHAALFVLPSHHEGLPIAALEAASHGIPVLLSDIPANRDLGLPDAHYFPVGDINALSNRLTADFETMRTDPTWISDAFDWDRIAQATATVYSGAA